MAHFNSPTDTKNFNGTANWVPEIFSKKVQIAFRKSSVCEAITNTDYTGEISQYGDTVNIIVEPDINVTSYLRGTTLSGTALTDTEKQLIVDQANYFQFEIDDLEKKFSHINWQALATDRAGYKLKDAVDSDILTYMYTTLIADTGYGDSGNVQVNTHGTLTDPIDCGHDSGEVDPLDVLSRLARLLDQLNVPEDGRWVVASPIFYEELMKTSSKLISVDYNGGQGDLRNGLVASGKLRGFQMYKSNNLTTLTGTGTSNGVTIYKVMAGHMSSTASATALTKIENIRSTTTFSDIVRGLHVWGRKLLRPEALTCARIKID